MSKIKTGLLAMAMSIFATFATAHGHFITGLPLLHHAAMHGDALTVTTELRRGVDPNLIGEARGIRWTALYLAASNNDYFVAEILLEWGADPNLAVNGITPLMNAMAKGNRDMSLLLRQYGGQLP